MDKVNVQLLFTSDEYENLKIEADKVDLTVPLYIKSEIFGTCYRALIEKVETLNSGTKFNIKALFGVEWTMSRGIKLNLRKTFYGHVNSGSIKNVEKIRRDSSNVM